MVGGRTSPYRARVAPSLPAAPAQRDLVASALRASFFLAYPFVVYGAYTRFGARAVGAVLLGLYGLTFLLRARGPRYELWGLARQHLLLVGMIALAVVSGERILLLLLPAAVSLYLLWTFASSLHPGPPLIERIARLVEDDLPDFTLPYCRKVTIAWCAFLAANTLCAALLALRGPLEWWALYTGLVFYLLLGALLAGEFLLRKLWFRYYGHGIADRILARVFPAERTANGRRSLAYVERRSGRPGPG